MAFSREGFTIDVVTRLVRRSLLNPAISVAVTLPCALFYVKGCMPGDILPFPLPQARWPWLVVGGAWSLLSLLIWATDYLNDEYANNWASDSIWDWNKEIVLVTGGSSGVGASVVQHLLKNNLKTTIIILDFTALNWTPPPKSKIYYYQCDLSSSATIKYISAKVRKEVGHPTVLINNAGLCRGLTVMDGSYADIEITVRTNLIAPLLLTKEFLPFMVRNNHGHILNISSMSSVMPLARIADYAATKAGLNAFHEALQLELKNVHKAPKVRLTLGIFSFIQTPLFRGETDLPHFVVPLLHVDTVGETLVDILYSGRGKTLYMPGTMRFLHILRAMPEWTIRVLREGSKDMVVGFKGRQAVDEKTGGLS